MTSYVTMNNLVIYPEVHSTHVLGPISPRHVISCFWLHLSPSCVLLQWELDSDISGRCLFHVSRQL